MHKLFIIIIILILILTQLYFINRRYKEPFVTFLGGPSSSYNVLKTYGYITYKNMYIGNADITPQIKFSVHDDYSTLNIAPTTTTIMETWTIDYMGTGGAELIYNSNADEANITALPLYKWGAANTDGEPTLNGPKYFIDTYPDAQIEPRTHPKFEYGLKDFKITLPDTINNNTSRTDIESLFLNAWRPLTPIASDFGTRPIFIQQINDNAEINTNEHPIRWGYGQQIASNPNKNNGQWAKWFGEVGSNGSQITESGGWSTTNPDKTWNREPYNFVIRNSADGNYTKGRDGDGVDAAKYNGTVTSETDLRRKQYLAKIYMAHYIGTGLYIRISDSTSNWEAKPSANYFGQYYVNNNTLYTTQHFITKEMIDELQYKDLELKYDKADGTPTTICKFKDGDNGFIKHNIIVEHSSIFGNDDSWGGWQNSSGAANMSWKQKVETYIPHSDGMVYKPYLTAKTELMTTPDQRASNKGNANTFWTTYNYNKITLPNYYKLRRRLIDILKFKDHVDLLEMVSYSNNSDYLGRNKSDDWDVSRVIDMNNLFSKNSNDNRHEAFSRTLNTIRLDGWDTSNVTDMSSMFRDAETMTHNGKKTFGTLKGEDGGWDGPTCVKKVTDFGGMFATWPGLAGRVQPNWTDLEYGLNISKWRFKQYGTINFSNMFKVTGIPDQVDVSAIPINFSGWNTNRVTNMSGMFESACIDISGIESWIVTNVTTMAWMFKNYTKKTGTLGIGGWNTLNVTNMTYMFKNSSMKIDDLKEWKVNNVTNMRSMFENFTESTNTLDMTAWNVKNVIDFDKVFYGSKIKLNPVGLGKMLETVSSITLVNQIIDSLSVNNFTNQVEAQSLPALWGNTELATNYPELFSQVEPRGKLFTKEFYSLPTTTSLPPTTTSLPPTTTSLPPTTTSLPPTTTSLTSCIAETNNCNQCNADSSACIVCENSMNLYDGKCNEGGPNCPPGFKLKFGKDGVGRECNPSLNTHEEILFKANDDGGGGIKFDNMNEENDYFIIKNDGDQYLTYTNTNNIPEVKYEVINLNSIESKFKFKIDTLDNNENDNPFWGDGATTTNPPNYIIYPESNPEVYLTLLNDTDGEGWLTIESKLDGGDSNIKRQIFSDN